MPTQRVWPCTLIVTALACPMSRAEVPILKPDELACGASHIVVGKLVRVHRSVEWGEALERTRGIAELLVGRVEKGEGPEAGEVVFVRFWNQRRFGGDGPRTHSLGHDVPAEGAIVRAHVKRGPDGSYEALLPNGLTPAAEEAHRPR